MNKKDIEKMLEAYLSVVSEKKAVCETCGKMREGECEEVEESKKEGLDPVNDKENDKKFKDRKDKDIDNDGDVDDSDEFLHKRRAAIDNEKDGGEKPADNADDKKKKKPAGNSGEKTAEISKIGEKVKEEYAASFLAALEEAANPKAGATAPEGLTDKESPKSKEFIAKHKVDKKDHDEMEKIEEPKERKVQKEDTRTYQQKIMDILSGKTWGEVQGSIDELKDAE